MTKILKIKTLQKAYFNACFRNHTQGIHSSQGTHQNDEISNLKILEV